MARRSGLRNNDGNAHCHYGDLGMGGNTMTGQIAAILIVTAGLVGLYIGWYWEMHK